MYSNSRNHVPQVAQRYGNIAAHTRHRASVLVVFVVFCVHMYSFAGLIGRTPPPTFSDTALLDVQLPEVYMSHILNRQSIFQINQRSDIKADRIEQNLYGHYLQSAFYSVMNENRRNKVLTVIKQLKMQVYSKVKTFTSH